jgi:hypothetical protein
MYLKEHVSKWRPVADAFYKQTVLHQTLSTHQRELMAEIHSQKLPFNIKDLLALANANTDTDALDQAQRAAFLWHLHECTHHPLTAWMRRNNVWNDKQLCTRPVNGWACPYEEYYPAKYRYFWAGNLPMITPLLRYVSWFQVFFTTHGIVKMLRKCLPVKCGHRDMWSTLSNECAPCKKNCHNCDTCRRAHALETILMMIMRCCLSGGYPHSLAHPNLSRALSIVDMFEEPTRHLMSNPVGDIDKVIWFALKEALLWFLKFDESLMKDVCSHYKWDVFVESTLKGTDGMRAQMASNDPGKIDFKRIGQAMYEIYQRQQVQNAYKVIKKTIGHMLEHAVSKIPGNDMVEFTSELWQYAHGDPVNDIGADALESAGLSEKNVQHYRSMWELLYGAARADNATKHGIGKFVAQLDDEELKRIRSAIFAFKIRTSAWFYPLSRQVADAQIKAICSTYNVAPSNELQFMMARHPEHWIEMRKIAAELAQEQYCVCCTQVSSVVHPAYDEMTKLSRSRTNAGLGISDARYSFFYDRLYCKRNHPHDGALLPLSMIGAVWTIGKQHICLCEQCGRLMNYNNNSFHGGRLLCHAEAPDADSLILRSCCYMCRSILRQPRNTPVLDDYTHPGTITLRHMTMCTRHNQRAATRCTIPTLKDVYRRSWEGEFCDFDIFAAMSEELPILSAPSEQLTKQTIESSADGESTDMLHVEEDYCSDEDGEGEGQSKSERLVSYLPPGYQPSDVAYTHIYDDE